jgi:hypothetical protein
MLHELHTIVIDNSTIKDLLTILERQKRKTLFVQDFMIQVKELLPYEERN